ncbi:MAG: DMT family transporter [Oscillospiraceae bacterium]|nr:DMT family transporter [Oscillospiraceae bacterium]
MKKHIGITTAMLSAFIFGFTHILVKMSYDGGGNGITVTFFRAAFAVPVLFVILRAKKIPFRVNRKEIRDLLVIGALGSAATPLLLYTSYSYISVGLAAVLHFFFPVIITLANVMFFKEKASRPIVLSVMLGIAGVALSFEGALTGNPLGFALALASGVTHAVYMLGVQHTALRGMHCFKISFYLCIVQAAISLPFGWNSQSLVFQLTPAAWGYILAVSLFTVIGALSLLQVSVRYAGATAAAVLSTIEPITSVILGALLLSETFTPLKILSAVFILASVVLVCGFRRESNRSSTS